MVEEAKICIYLINYCIFYYVYYHYLPVYSLNLITESCFIYIYIYIHTANYVILILYTVK